MPAQGVIVHDNPEFLAGAADALRRAAHGVVAFSDPLLALDVLEAPKTVELLITRVQFPAGMLNGIALARMVRSKRLAVKVLFVALPEFAEIAEGLGEFMPMPVDVVDVVDAAERLLTTEASR